MLFVVSIDNLKKTKNEDEKLFKEDESIETLKILDLFENI